METLQAVVVRRASSVTDFSFFSSVATASVLPQVEIISYKEQTYSKLFQNPVQAEHVEGILNTLFALSPCHITIHPSRKRDELPGRCDFGRICFLGGRWKHENQSSTAKTFSTG